MKIRPVGAELFHAAWRTEEQTDMTQLVVALHNSAQAPKKVSDWLSVETRLDFSFGKFGIKVMNFLKATKFNSQ